MTEAELIIGGRTDSGAEPGQVQGFVGPDFEAEFRGIDENEAVAVPRPSTSRLASSRSANEGRLCTSMLLALPSSQ